VTRVTGVLKGLFDLPVREKILYLIIINKTLSAVKNIFKKYFYQVALEN